MPRILDIPCVLGVKEARDSLPEILKGVIQGESYIVRGPRGREALVIGVDTFRELQRSYLALAGELETRRVLDDDQERERLDSARKRG